MNLSKIVLYQSEYCRLKLILSKLQKDLRAALVLLINRSGQQIASEGSAHGIDLTALATLAAANLAATDGLARLIGEREFTVLHHQGKHLSIYISDLAQSLSLVLLFDATLPMGMVRWKVKRVTAVLDEVFENFRKQAERSSGSAAPDAGPACFTDEEIEKLLSSKIYKKSVDRKARR